jgi:hypothetical protein
VTIYVDSAGHLISSESLDELHCFAKKIGLKREWFQAHDKHPHYDLTTTRKRHLAILHGATLVSSKEIVRILKGHCSG